MPTLYYGISAVESTCTCGAQIAWVATARAPRFPLDLARRHPDEERKLAEPHWLYCPHATPEQRSLAKGERQLGTRQPLIDFGEPLHAQDPG